MSLLTSIIRPHQLLYLIIQKTNFNNIIILTTIQPKTNNILYNYVYSKDRQVVKQSH